MRDLVARAFVAWGAGLCLSLLGCSPLLLSVQSKRLAASTLLAGRVSSRLAWHRPVVVVAWSERRGRIKPSRYRLLDEPGEYAVIVPNGTYRLQAFGDANGNLVRDPEEPVGSYAGLRRIVASGGVLPRLDFDLLEADPSTPRLPSLPLPETSASTQQTQAGAIVRLDDALFSRQSGTEGYWKPRTVLQRIGANIYFLEPYDPKRTPVLFVHGATGTPRDWRFFIEHLDRSRFQAWIYSFPSGAGIDTLSDLLFWKLSNLQERFRFRTLQIAAHSLGGLVVRSLLGKYQDRLAYVRMFASFSTPWGGEDRAKLAPASVAAWSDLQPGGAFLASLFERRLPAGTEFYLFFGYRGERRGLFRPENDGVVTLKSELSPKAQSEARRILGFAESHSSILTSPEVVSAFHALLGRLEETGPASSSIAARALPERDAAELPNQ